MVSGLAAPWAIAFLPDGTALVSERDSGRVLSVGPGGALREVQRLAVTARGEGGLLGLAVSPGFASNGLVYAYHSTGSDNRVVRFRLGQPAEPVLIGIPVASNHNGGRIAFGPDGLLYVATGDAGDPSRAQDRGSLAGKILRVNADGSVPPGNPFASPVWSFGHRNVQGLAWRGDGRMYATELGQNTFDELNHIVPGANYGWPVVEGRAGDGRFTDPIAQWSPAEASPSGAVVLTGGSIPQWEGDVLFAGLRGQRLWRVDLDADGGVAGTEALFAGDFGRLRHAAQAPDGSLWVLTNNTDGRGDPRRGDDRILRIGPS
ncbi:PQQ-dependent sugar dehydrogenase [soil metagenome]